MVNYWTKAIDAFRKDPQKPLAFEPGNLEVAIELLEQADSANTKAQPIIGACRKLVSTSHTMAATRALTAAASRLEQRPSDEIFVRVCGLLATRDATELQWIAPFASWLGQHKLFDNTLAGRLFAIAGDTGLPFATPIERKSGQARRGSEGKFGLYSGGCVGTVRHGYGFVIYPDGTRFEGTFRDNRANGHVIVIYADGGRYEGGFKNGTREGYGIFKHPNGAGYEGYREHGNAHGQGTLTFSNGNQYEGGFFEGKIRGQGTYSWVTGDRYAGLHRDGMRDGHGVLTVSDGSVYDQEWALDTLKVNERRVPSLVADNFLIQAGCVVDAQTRKGVWRLAQINKVTSEEVEVRFIGEYSKMNEMNEMINTTDIATRLAMRDTKTSFSNPAVTVL